MHCWILIYCKLTGGTLPLNQHIYCCQPAKSERKETDAVREYERERKKRTGLCGSMLQVVPISFEIRCLILPFG